MAKTPVVFRPQSRQPAAGDVIVTKVAERYHIGQVHAARSVLTQIAMRTSRNDALVLAFRFATSSQRVFLYNDVGPHYVEIDLATLH